MINVFYDRKGNNTQMDGVILLHIAQETSPTVIVITLAFKVVAGLFPIADWSHRENLVVDGFSVFSDQQARGQPRHHSSVVAPSQFLHCFHKKNFKTSIKFE